MNFLTITTENENEAGFKEIALKLFDNYVIQTHDAKYRLIEIEFYWNSPTHVDKSTYPRKHIIPITGEWFFHYTGVDIVLDKDINNYGGILIRGIFNTETKQPIHGPMICRMKLFSGINAFSSNVNTQIIPCDNLEKIEKSDILCKQRVRIPDERKYNFYIPVRHKIIHHN